MEEIVCFFAWLMDLCYRAIPNHWIDIILFTFITKVLQMPLSLWCHMNSLKMVAIMPKAIRIKVSHYGDREAIDEETAALFKREGYHPFLSLAPLALQFVILMGFVRVIYGIADAEKGSLLGCVPVRDGGITWVMPFVAGTAAWFLGWCQNRISPLQREQSRTQQMATNGISIAVSLSLGFFVGMGVGLYWAVSNVFSVLVQLCCNALAEPARYVDYAALRAAQDEMQKLEEGFTHKATPEEIRRERADYRAFFQVANKHLVFYAEGGGYYKYFQALIEWLLDHSNVVIHYLTNDPQDAVFERAKAWHNLCPYYIGQKKIIPLMMKMDADMVVMTSPDLGRYHIKRSYVRKNTEYVYLCHGPTSTHMCTRNGAYDNFDTIFVSGPFQVAEVRATERLYGLKAKNLIETGYLFLDTLFRQYEGAPRPSAEGLKRILVAPSYQEDNILDSCLDELLGCLLAQDRKVVVRPHPQYVRRHPSRIAEMLERYHHQIGEHLSFEIDFSSNSSIYESDVLVTDWSSIAYEFAFTTKRPCLFVNTAMKVINPEYARIGIEPTDIWFRNEVGVSVNKGEWLKASHAVADMLMHPDGFAARIEALLKENFYNPGKSAAVAGMYILKTLVRYDEGERGMP